MKLLLFGGNGFIGRAFANNYHTKLNLTIVDQFSSPSKLNSDITEIIGDISDKEFVEKVSRGFDCVINLVYDRQNLRNNFKIINNITSACLNNKIEKLIHISTISVYDPYINGSLNEKSTYSKLYDPYSYIKQRQEKILNTFSKDHQCCEITILQPTIVYGEGGNWSNHANKEILKQKLFLPNKGNYICNIVHVNEVSNAIFLVVSKPKNSNRIERFLISGKEHITWKEFYNLHAKELKQITNYSIHEIESNRNFHDNFLKNAVYKILFSKFGCYFILLMSRYLYRKKTKMEENTSNVFIPIGMNRLVHNSNFIVSSKKFSTNYY
jgi:nucleoside-diphosphate-sugar epimerase